jgi:RluA family pseudouridine synthase
MSSVVTNISTYCFTPLDGLKDLRIELMDSCKAWNLKGTILLSTEGINLFVAGDAADIERLMERLHRIPGLEGLTPKISLSDAQPFKRMLVRIKREIIAFGVETVRPAEYTSPKIKATELKRWLDEGRPVTLLDTRNDYEVKLGTFKGALVPDIHTFREFPDAVRKLPPGLKEAPVVMFCTGGIRCEKAGPFMEQEGFREIYQLDGGILKYFEECGGDHYEGECFVFDQRVGVDPALSETDTAVCFACQAPLDLEAQQDSRYVIGVSCPHCYKSEPQRLAEQLEARRRRLKEVADPLPGATPYQNRRPINVPAAHDGRGLLEVLVDLFPQIEPEEWRSRVAQGRFLSLTGEVLDSDHPVRGGERVMQIFPEAAEPPVNGAVEILHEDEAVVVLLKPAPLPMHPSGRFNRNTLQHLLLLTYQPEVLRPVHRLDANTTGVVVFARNRQFCRTIQEQFLAGTVEKKYLVRVQGHPVEDSFLCETRIAAEPGPLGTHVTDVESGQDARTRFTVISRDGDGSALLEARLLTGRTNQIRVHLWEMGHPVFGDPAYLTEKRLGDTQTLDPEDAPLCLHAWRLAFDHPLSGKRLVFETARPDWAGV